MDRILAERNRTTLLSAVAALLLCILVAMVARGGIWQRERVTSFRKLPMAYELTQGKAVLLNRYQINGTQPLARVDDNMATDVKYEPPTLRDIVLSMAEDYERSVREDAAFTGLSAMHYNVPVSVCYIPQMGSESGVLMFNLDIVGYTPDYGEAQEWSNFCQRGQQPYGVTRFLGVWVEYTDAAGRRVLFWAEDMLGRTLQHLYWLNRGVLPCSQWSPQKQADALYQIRNINMVTKQH